MAVSPISRSLALYTAVIMTLLVLMTSASPRRTSTQDPLRSNAMERLSVGSYDDNATDYVYGDEDEDYTSDSNKVENDDDGDWTDLLTTLGSDSGACSANQYLDIKSQQCRQCSSCPLNKIIRVPCSRTRDSVCGPFFEFDFQPPMQSPVEGNSQVNYGHHEDGHQGKVDSSEAGLDMTPVTLTAAGHEWRTLAVALIIVLAVICCIVVFAGLYVWIFCRRIRQQHQYLRQPELLPTRLDPDSEPRYVETYFTSSRDRIRTSRPLPGYQPIYTGSHFLPPMTSSLKTNAAPSAGSDPSDHEYIYINCPDDVVNAER